MTQLESAHALLVAAEREDELGRCPLVERLALLGTFDPQRLDESQRARDVMKLLCERLPSRDAILGERWRVDALVRMLRRGGRAELARVRRTVAPHVESPLQRMLDAFVLGGGPSVGERDQDELLASLEVWRWATEAVARAGRSGEISIEPGSDEIESRLALLDVTHAVRRLAAAGCVGRESELALLHEYRQSKHAWAGLTDEPALVVYGIGGVGKSTLVARFVMDLYEQRSGAKPGVWAYLDLDRPTLASCDPDVVLADIIRQVAAQAGDERRGLVRATELRRRRRKGAGLESNWDAGSYRRQAGELSNALQTFADGSLVVVVDTYEQLERNRPDEAQPLFDLFSYLAEELPRFRLIVSGRAPAAAFVDESRPDRQLHVLALDDGAAVHLLRHFVEHEAQQAERPVATIGDDLGREVIALVGGIPLTVRLAARVLVQEGPDAIADVAQRARTLDRVRSEFVRGFLYQRILSHIAAPPPDQQQPRPHVTTDDLRRLARASIALRLITVDLVERVLAPSLHPPPTAGAHDLFEALAAEVAFAELHDGTLRLREELRAPALVALRLDDPALVQRVHELAATFYAATPGDPDAALELAYHQLALGTPPTEFDAATLRRLEPAVDDLPPASAERVRDAIGGGAALVTALDQDAWERKVLPAAESALRAGRLEDARRLLAERTERGAGSELYRLESRLAQAEADLVGATVAAERDLRAALTAADGPRFAAAAVRLAGLDEREGEATAADDTLRTAIAQPLLGAALPLRLELLLNRINLRERTGLETEDSRWLLGLEARALMQRSDPRELSSNSALPRLLAAALGREEPERIREAVRRVGVGHEEDPVRVQVLVGALADWDAGQPEPGRLARRANLRLEGEDPKAIRRAWTALTGLGTDAGLVLDQLWRETTPPERVLEALRQIYLWWAVDTGSEPTPGEPQPWPDFLTDVPIDWSRQEFLNLEELILTAYPTSTEIVALVSLVGLDLGAISRSSSGRRIAREIIGTAGRAGLLELLVEVILSDRSAASVHKPLRDLVGDDWLSAHGLTT